MSDWRRRPEAVEQAVAWLRENDQRFTEDALRRALRDQGYAEAEIGAAFERRQAELPTVPADRDLRGRAAAILILAFLGTWAVLSYLLVANDQSRMGIGQAAALVLGVILGVIGLFSLFGIAASGRLRRGAEGALVAVLVIPFIFLFIVAGLCVATMGNTFA